MEIANVPAIEIRFASSFLNPDFFVLSFRKVFMHDCERARIFLIFLYILIQRGNKEGELSIVI